MEDECEWPLRWSFLRGRLLAPPSPVEEPGVGAGRVGVPVVIEREMSRPAGFFREMPEASPIEPGGGPPPPPGAEPFPPASRRELELDEVRSRVLPEDDDEADEVGGRGAGWGC